MSKRNQPWITREGKLGGKGFLSKSFREQKKLLNRSVAQFGYRSTLGSLLVLERNRTIKSRHGAELRGLRTWLKEKYGGSGSFGPHKERRSNTAPARKNTQLKPGTRVEYTPIPGAYAHVLTAHAGDRYDIRWTRSGTVQKGVKGSKLKRARAR